MAANGRIDVHHHVLPEFYIKAQKGAGIGGTAYRGFPEWTPSHSMSVMDNENIAAATVAKITRDMVRRHRADETGAAMQRLPCRSDGRPFRRLGGFASLPLPDINASIEECSRALDDLELDGITLLTSIDDKYIGHPDFEPLFGTEQT